MPTSESSFLRQLSEKEGWNLKSKRWTKPYTTCTDTTDTHLNQIDMYATNAGPFTGIMPERRKRVMVVVDQSIHSKHAMLWALTHVANQGDMLTLLQIQTTPNFHKDINPSSSSSSSSSSAPDNLLVTSLGALCKACKPEVEVEALVIQGGPKLATVVSQVKKLEVSVLVLGQKNSSPILRCLGGMSSTEKFVEQCINTVECLTIGVKKQSKGIGGYLISTRWHKDFWLLA
ncbi:putative rossmann-like alpha/beta/alpha sandwich protein [Helianthus debilis subsp. tardiflorus]